MLYPSVGRSRIREDCVFATSKCVYPRYRLTHARTCSTRRSTTRCPLASHRPRGSVSTIPPLLGSGAACFIAVTWYGCDVTRSLTILCPRHWPYPRRSLLSRSLLSFDTFLSFSLFLFLFVFFNPFLRSVSLSPLLFSSWWPFSASLSLFCLSLRSFTLSYCFTRFDNFPSLSSVLLFVFIYTHLFYILYTMIVFLRFSARSSRCFDFSNTLGDCF